ncbi:MAG: hypothetical protein WDA16_09500 [Candidatus Thermoplasmatota archaeon]
MRGGPGVVFVVAVVALAGLAIADLTYATSHMSAGYSGGFRSNEARAVLVRSVEVHPGDRLLVMQNIGGDAWPSGLRSYDFLILPGGDGLQLLNGTPPRAIYYERDNMTSQSCCPDGWVAWDRPDDALAHRAPRPAFEFTPGVAVNDTEMALAVYDQPERIDLVWLYHWAPDAKQPATPEDRARFDSAREISASARLGFQVQFDPGYPTVLASTVPRAHPAFFAAMVTCALVASGAVIAWGLRLRRAHVEPEAIGTEALLRLHDTAGAYLTATRDILLGSLVVVLGVSLHVALIGEPGWLYTLLERASDVGLWSKVLTLALCVLYAGVVVVWLDAVWRVHRALKRWRARRATETFSL